METYVSIEGCKMRHRYTTWMLRGAISLFTLIVLIVGSGVVAVVSAVDRAEVAGAKADGVKADVIREHDVVERTKNILGKLDDIIEEQRRQRTIMESWMRGAPPDRD